MKPHRTPMYVHGVDRMHLQINLPFDDKIDDLIVSLTDVVSYVTAVINNDYNVIKETLVWYCLMFPNNECILRVDFDVYNEDNHNTYITYNFKNWTKMRW